MVMRMMDTMKSFILLISAKPATLSTTKCTASWCNRFNQVSV